MIGRAALIRLKNNESYLGVVTHEDEVYIHLHVWQDKETDTVQRMRHADTIYVAYPVSGVKNENFIRNMLEKSKRQQEEQMRQQSLNAAANSRPQIMRPM